VQPKATSIRQPPSRPGGRPSRRIILPPRTFPAHEVSREGIRIASRRLGTLSGGSRADRKWHCRMPVNFNFPETSFDAIIAWDVFNYYDPESVSVIAAEVRRVLKPGGLVLAYFDTARTEEPAAPWRYNIVDDKHVQCDPITGRLMLRQVYQNRDIEKMFAGLRIVELYFLKNSMREVLMEKKDIRETPRVAPPKPKTPRPRFTIE
jgi:SAM-dependent methyltransferase